MKILAELESERKYAGMYERLFNKNNIGTTFSIGILCCLAAHIFYLITFAVNHVTEMAVFNIFSVTMYFSMLIAAHHIKKLDTLTYISIAEIIIHAAAATCLIGWQPDFGMFLLMIIPATFLIPHKKVYPPYITAFVSIVTYVILRLNITDQAQVKYNFTDHRIIALITIVNAIMGTNTLIYASAGYILYRKYLEYNLACLATLDPLTKLRNRRDMNERIKQISSAGKKYVIGIGDIDSFKNVNDTYGHDTGDTVLVYVAEVLSRNIPDNGYVARWGGEEFLFIIADSDTDAGVSYTEEIHKELRSHVFSVGEREFGVTMTFGVSCGSAGDNKDSVINTADKLLYTGKNNGKNHTEY